MRSLKQRIFSPAVPFDPARRRVFYGWWVLAAGTVGIVLSTPGQTVGVGPFTESLMRALGLSRVQLSNAYLAGTVLSGFLLPWSGRLFDRIGARVLGSMAVLGLGVHLMLMAQVEALRGVLDPQGENVVVAWGIMFVGFFLLRFLGQGNLTLVCRSMITKWFQRRRGFASALNGMVLTLCFTTSPLILMAGIERFSWDGLWNRLGFAYTTAGLLFVWLFFRDNPEECGLHMDGDRATTVIKPEAHIQSAQREFTVPEAMRTWAFWLFTFGFAIIALNVTAWTFHAISLSQALGLQSDGLYELLPMAAMVNIAMGFASGWLCDRYALRYTAIIMLVAQALSVVGLLLLPGGWGKVLFIGAHGVSLGCWGTLMNVTVPTLFGRKHMGAINGRILSATVIASALGPSLYSYSEVYGGSYHTALWISFAIPVMLAVGAVAPSPTWGRQAPNPVDTETELR